MQLLQIASLAVLAIGVQADCVPGITGYTGDPTHDRTCNVTDVQILGDYFVDAGDQVVSAQDDYAVIGHLNNCYILAQTYSNGSTGCQTTALAKDIGATIKDFQYDYCGNPDTCEGAITVYNNDYFQLSISQNH